MIKRNNVILREAVIANKIITIRGEKVMLDVHLAEMYEVETRALKQAVRRNIERFPDDFMYELTDAEIEEVVSQNVIPSKKHLGGAIPFAFTENGIAMLPYYSPLNAARPEIPLQYQPIVATKSPPTQYFFYDRCHWNIPDGGIPQLSLLHRLRWRNLLFVKK